jgi:hypothetical protein
MSRGASTPVEASSNEDSRDEEGCLPRNADPPRGIGRRRARQPSEDRDGGRFEERLRSFLADPDVKVNPK